MGTSKTVRDTKRFGSGYKPEPAAKPNPNEPEKQVIEYRTRNFESGYEILWEKNTALPLGEIFLSA